MKIVSSVELAEQLRKLWDLPESITGINISMSVSQNPEITVTYLVTQEDAELLLYLTRSYNLVYKNNEQATD